MTEAVDYGRFVHPPLLILRFEEALAGTHESEVVLVDSVRRFRGCPKSAGHRTYVRCCGTNSPSRGCAGDQSRRRPGFAGCGQLCGWTLDCIDHSWKTMSLVDL
jgi:hypothetical protein